MRGLIDIRLPVIGSPMVRTIGHKLCARKARPFKSADFGEGVGFHVQHVAVNAAAARSERIAAAAHRIG